MTKKLLIVLLGLVSLNRLQAEKVEGIIILNNDSTVNVTLDIPIKPIVGGINYEGIQLMIRYYNKQNQIVKLKPDQIKEVRFNHGNEEVRMISCFNNLKLEGSYFSSPSKILLKLRIDNRLRLYTYYFKKNVPNGAVDAERFILQKNYDILFEPRWLHFEKDMHEYLSDCVSLVKKIDNKSYNSDDIEAIVNEYNACK